VTNEVFSGIKIIKLYAWERSFQVSKHPHASSPSSPPPSFFGDEYTYDVRRSTAAPPSLPPSLPPCLPQEKIGRVRDKELRMLRQYMMTNIVARFTWSIVPLAVSLTSFAVYVLVRREGGREGGRDGGRDGDLEGGRVTAA